MSIIKDYTAEDLQNAFDKGRTTGRQEENDACSLIAFDLARSPAMFPTMAEYHAYKDGVMKYKDAIVARCPK